MAYGKAGLGTIRAEDGTARAGLRTGVRQCYREEDSGNFRGRKTTRVGF